ncbi:hypothetical protein LguiA_013966 [Lonicera macranthoides]
MTLLLSICIHEMEHFENTQPADKAAVLEIQMNVVVSQIGESAELGIGKFYVIEEKVKLNKLEYLTWNPLLTDILVNVVLIYGPHNPDILGTAKIGIVTCENTDGRNC